jgi:hypothetical protein
MTVSDWRAWVSQSVPPGGRMPGVAPPTPFPGVLPIPLTGPDYIDGTLSIPAYSNTPVTIKPIDPFYVGTYPTGGGWVTPMEFSYVTYAGMPSMTSLPGMPLMRPAVPGLTSP